MPFKGFNLQKENYKFYQYLIILDPRQGWGWLSGVGWWTLPTGLRPCSGERSSSTQNQNSFWNSFTRAMGGRICIALIFSHFDPLDVVHYTGHPKLWLSTKIAPKTPCLMTWAKCPTSDATLNLPNKHQTDDFFSFFSQNFLSSRFSIFEHKVQPSKLVPAQKSLGSWFNIDWNST